jgi:hypothetical protein
MGFFMRGEEFFWVCGEGCVFRGDLGISTGLKRGFWMVFAW